MTTTLTLTLDKADAALLAAGLAALTLGPDDDLAAAALLGFTLADFLDGSKPDDPPTGWGD